MKTLLAAAILSVMIHPVFSQELNKEKLGGNWVVESNIATPRDQVVKFYNSRLELIYQERILHKKIRIEKEKVRNQLDKALTAALNDSSFNEAGSLASLLRNKGRERSSRLQ